jgi:hypothetical protein
MMITSREKVTRHLFTLSVNLSKLFLMASWRAVGDKEDVRVGIIELFGDPLWIGSRRIGVIFVAK